MRALAVHCTLYTLRRSCYALAAYLLRCSFLLVILILIMLHCCCVPAWLLPATLAGCAPACMQECVVIILLSLCLTCFNLLRWLHASTAIRPSLAHSATIQLALLSYCLGVSFIFFLLLGWALVYYIV